MAHVLKRVGSGFSYATNPMGEKDGSIPAGFYEPHMSVMDGFVLYPRSLGTEGLYDLGGVGAKIVGEIREFLGSRAIFERLRLPHKRGFLLHGTPGCGKSALLRLIMRDFLNLTGGIVLEFGELAEMTYGLIRQHEESRPILFIAEDLDGMSSHKEKAILNFLDGSGGLDNAIFLATTNYLERVPDRIKARPSRIDRVVEIPLPTPMEQTMYLVGVGMPEEYLDLVLPACAGLTLAETKEVCIGVLAFKQDAYEIATRLKGLRGGLDLSGAAAIRPSRLRVPVVVSHSDACQCEECE